MNQIRHYVDGCGRDPFAEWRQSLRDIKTRIAIDRRIMRLELGNAGDHKHVRDGVWELRIHTGPGFRIYYGKSGNTVVVLLCGGDKGSQDADIERACMYWQDWQRRAGDER
ncbi:type II toxin-antitoxin system RelE/ParE family toxin [Stenotrophomonas sp.]|uniref:type II toxin-antitoxin system RelE/ParE family toxin n=1 Tax=Stenotrophomonas sp. TaxID=69392 RepID=UPI0028A6C482|nr:type II toxin-antitoxin system RelE/ParE family toxin [Stenotrophomonas sp.]